MTGRITIGLATPADACEIAVLSRRCIEQGLRWRYTPALVRRLLRKRSANVIVARDRHHFAGFGIMSYGEHCANLDLLAVPAAYRRRGVGRQIIAWLEKVALTAGIASIFVQVRTRNRSAIRFYRRLGFVDVDEAPGYYQGRESAVILGKAIRPAIDAARKQTSVRGYRWRAKARRA